MLYIAKGKNKNNCKVVFNATLLHFFCRIKAIVIIIDNSMIDSIIKNVVDMFLNGVKNVIILSPPKIKLNKLYN